MRGKQARSTQAKQALKPQGASRQTVSMHTTQHNQTLICTLGSQWKTRQPFSVGAMRGCQEGMRSSSHADGGEAPEQKSCSKSQKRTTARLDARENVGGTSGQGCTIQRRALSIAAMAARHTTCQMPWWIDGGGSASQSAVQEKCVRWVGVRREEMAAMTACAVGHSQKW